MPRARSSGPEQIYQLKVTLRDTKPPIWRRIQAPADVTLYKLHRIIQVVMGWENYHLYEFEIGQTRYGEPDPDWGTDVKSARRFRLGQLIQDESARFAYVYDMGDNWEHDIRVEKILPPDTEQRYPVCLAGKRACPPEDVGGVWGYTEFLEAIKDPTHERHHELLEWVGGRFYPGAFHLEEVNQELRRMR